MEAVGAEYVDKANSHCTDLCHAGEHEIEQGSSGSYSLIDV